MIVDLDVTEGFPNINSLLYVYTLTFLYTKCTGERSNYTY